MAPLYSFLKIDSGISSLVQEFHGIVKVSYTPPDPLYQNCLPASLVKPNHYLASKSSLSKGSLKLDYNGDELAGKLSYSISPALPEDMRKDAFLDLMPS